MNTAERVSHYSKLDPEGLVETANDPPKSWPEQGVIEFKDVRMSTCLGSRSLFLWFLWPYVRLC